MTMRERYSAALRQILVLETAYPGLAEISELWYFLPNGRPDWVSHDGRYVLFAYRAALATRDALREAMSARGAEKWSAALEAEAALLWQIEQSHMREPLARVTPTIPEFATLTSMLAVA